VKNRITKIYKIKKKEGEKRIEEQVSGCGHLKPCGSPDHRPFHLLPVQ
jgi:hypothetical protein